MAIDPNTQRPKPRTLSDFAPPALQGPLAPQAPKKRTGGEILADSARGVAQGAQSLSTGLAQVPNLLTGGALDQYVVRPAQRTLDKALGGPGQDYGIAGASGRMSEGLSSGLSPVLKAEQQKLQDADGWLAKAGTVATNPTLLGQFAAEQVPMLATLGTGAAGTASAKGAQAIAQGATPAVAQQVGKKAAERALIGANTAMGAGFAGTGAQQDAMSQPQEVWDANPEYQALVRAGTAPDQAKQQLALRAGQIAGAIAAPISGAAGAITAPLEASIFTRTLGAGVPALLSKQGAGIVARGIGKEAAEEAIQEGGEQFGQNVGIQQAVDPTRALSQDVADNAAIGGVLGGVLGGGLTAGGLALSRDPLRDVPPLPGAQPGPQQGQPPRPAAPRPPSPAEQEQQLRTAVAMAQTPEQAAAAGQALAGFLEQQGRLLEPPQTIVGDSQGNLQPNAPTPPQLFDAPRIRLGSVPGGVGSVQQAPRGVPAQPRVPFPDAAPGTLQDAVNAITEAQPEAAAPAAVEPPQLRPGETMDPETGEVKPREVSAAQQQQMDLQAALAASPTPDLLTPAGKRGKERRRDKKDPKAAGMAGPRTLEQPVVAAEGAAEIGRTPANPMGEADAGTVELAERDSVRRAADSAGADPDQTASFGDASDPIRSRSTGDATRVSGPSVAGVSGFGATPATPDEAADPGRSGLPDARSGAVDGERSDRATGTQDAGSGFDTQVAQQTPDPATQEGQTDGRGRAAEPLAQGGADGLEPVGASGQGATAARDGDGEPAVEAPAGAAAATAAAPGAPEVDAAAAGFAANTTEGDTDVRTNPEQGRSTGQGTAEAVESTAQGQEVEGEQAQQQLTGEALTAERKRIGLPRVIRKADAVAALRRAGMKKPEAEAAFNTLERKGLKEGTRMGDDVAALIAARTQPAASAPAPGEVVESGPASGRAPVDPPAAATDAAAGAQSPAKDKALRRIERGTAFFATRDRADEFIAAGGIGDTHEAVQAKPGRFDVRAKQASAEPAAAAPEPLPKRGEEDRKAMAERGIKPGMRVAYEGKDGRVEGTVQSVDRSGTEADVDGVYVRGLKLEPVTQAASAQFKNYEKWIADGKPVSAGMREQIAADDRLQDGEADMLLSRIPAERVEAAAAEAATSPANDLPAPTEAQKDAGNYKKGALSLHGLRISIENPAGTRRRPEWPPLAHHYGYIRGTEGKDGDHVDVFLGPDAENADLPVFVVDQVTQAGRFDEHKVMMGFADEAAAREGYLANYSPGWSGLGDITQMALADFKVWVMDPARTTKRASQADSFDARAAWEATSKPDRARMIDRFFGEGLTDAGERYSGRTWEQFNVGEQSTLSALLKAAANAGRREPDGAQQEAAPAITREQEAALYEYLREQTEGDALRYQLLAQKFQRVADDRASEEDTRITLDWLQSMAEDGTEKQRLAAEGKAKAQADAAESERIAAERAAESLSDLRAGKAGNERYALFLSTLSQSERDAIETVAGFNTRYMAFISARSAEFKAKGRSDSINDQDAFTAHIRAWVEGQKPAEVSPKSTSKTPTVDHHIAVMDAVRDGTGDLEAYRQSFAALADAPEAVKAELATKTKDELLKAGGRNFYARYKPEKKDTIIAAFYRDLLAEYALGKSYGPTSYYMTRGGMAEHERLKAEALRELVAGQTAETLAEYAAEVKAARAEYSERLAARKQAVTEPKSLDDFRQALSFHMGQGKTRDEAFRELSPEQRIRYDELEAESTREAREARKREARTSVRAAGQSTSGQIIETKHTREGYDLFVVQLSDRLSREDYQTMLGSAKRLGGWYSSFRGRGAVSGFQFKERASAEAFVQLAGGDTQAAQAQADQRRDSFQDDRSQSAVERLREMADRIEERADDALGADRKVNTDRRARMAASAERAAQSEKALARTMRNIATAIEAGDAKFLDAVRTKTQVELLATEVGSAKYEELRAKHPTYAEQERRRGEPPTDETADYAKWPTFTAFRSDLATLGRQLSDVEGTKKLGQQILSVADDVTDAFIDFAKENPLNLAKLSTIGVGDKVAEFANREAAERAIRRSKLVGKAIVLPIKRGVNRVIMSPSEAMARGVWQGDGDKRITLTGEFGSKLVETIGRRANAQNRLSVPWQFESAYQKRKALARLGIETPSEFRSALREFIRLQERATSNRVRELELSMVGRKNDGLDFFPTPQGVADQMVEAAEITPDMAVLEPSAGMGHLADRIRAAGAEPDVMEISQERRQLLEEKGYHLAEVNDFLALEPRKFFTFGDVFRAPDGTEGIMRGQGGMGSQRIRLEDEEGRGLGTFDRSDLEGVRHRGVASGYDRIIMNPPFSKRRDAEHVRHAYELLRPGGRIVAIMGEGVFFGSDAKAQEFREWLESVGGTSEKLEAGSFMDASLPVNTGVNARMVVIDKADPNAAAAPDEQAADPEADGPALFSLPDPEPQPVFYSAAARAIEEGKGAPKKGDAAAWKGWLDGAVRRGDMKQSERDWLDIDGWLDRQESNWSVVDSRGREVASSDDRGRALANAKRRTEKGEKHDIRPMAITREALAEFVRANEVRVSEVVLGNKDKAGEWEPTKGGFRRRIGNRWTHVWNPDSKGNVYGAGPSGFQRRFESVDEAKAHFDSLDIASSTKPVKFAKHRTPGGENYRELLLMLPSEQVSFNLQWEQQTDDMLTADLPSGRLALIVYDRQAPENGATLNTTDQDGEAGTPEVQYPSVDAAKDAARAMVVSRNEDKPGYRSSHWDQPNVLAHIRMDERTDAEGRRVLFVQEIQSDWHQAGRKKGYKSQSLPAENFVKKVGDEFFVWTRAVDQREWTQPGATEAEAVSNFLSDQARDTRVPNAPLKSTDEWAMLAFKRAARWAVDNGFDRIAWATGEQNAELFDLSKRISRVEYTGNGTLFADDLRGNRVINEIVKEDKLPDYIGKEAAEKLLAQEPKETRSPTGLPTKPSRFLEGIDLKIGGEGMRGFYDKILPAAVGKWAKKFGGKVGSAEFIGIEGPNDATRVHAIDITPAMVDAIATGQPLFSGIPGQPARALGVAPSQLQAAIANVIRGWNADTAPRVRVLADPEGLPARAKRDPRYRMAEGFYDQGNRTVYLIASNLPTERRALQVLAHEAVGHYGMEAITGPELWAELESAVARLETTATGKVGEALASARRRYAGADRATFTKEAIAVLAERGVQNSIVSRVVASVRRFLRSLGFDLRLSESDILAMLRDSARYLERGRQVAADQPVTGAAFARPDLDPKRRVPVIEAKANAYGPTGDAEQVRAARAAARADLNTQRKAGTKWTNAESGMRFRLSSDGIGELLSWTADPSKLDMLAALQQITEQGIVARVESSRVASRQAGQPAQAQTWATLYAPVKVGGKLKIARMVAKDAGGGAFVYDLQHSTVLDPTDAASDLPATESGSTGGPAGRAMTVSQLRAMVNADAREAWNWSMPADQLPGLTVPERTTAAGVLRTMAEQGGLFRYPPSRAGDLATVFEEVTEGTVSATYKGETLANFTEDLEDMAEVQKWELRTKDGRPMFVYVEVGGENRMYVDASPGRSGASMGSAVYAALFQYALNDGKVLIGDPNGLSPEALLRRTEHMLSAALKHGTTRMMAPHPRQVDPTQGQWDSGPQAWAHPLRWEPGNDDANLRALIETTHHNAAAFLRGTDGEGAVYSFPAKKFLTRDGRELTQADIARISKQAGKSWRAGLAEPLGNPNVSLIGPTTVARSIIAGTLLRAEDSQLAKPLLADMNRRAQAGAAAPAEGLFYSLREPEAMGANADPRGFLARLGALMKPENLTLREAIAAKLQDVTPAALGALTLRHIAELGKKYLPQLPSYIDNLNRMQTDRNILQEEGNELAEKWRGMQVKDRQSAEQMADLMHDATIEGVDPAEEYQPLTMVNLSRETVPITDAAVRDHIKRKRAQFRSRPGDDKRAEFEEIKVLRQKLAAEKRRRRTYPQLVARWNQLPAEWKELYREARDMYSKRSDQTLEALMARIGDLDMEDEQKRKTGAQIRLMFEQARLSGPYFPLQRFGSYWVAAKNPDTGKRDFFMFESAADQLAGQRDLQVQGYTDLASGKKLEQARDAFGAGEGFMTEVQRKLQKARVPPELQDEIWQLYLHTLPDLSQRKHMIHRKKVAGYNPDALRAFAANANHGAYQVARLRYGHKMQRLVMQAKTWADSSAKTDQGNQASIYYNELVKRHDWVMNPSDSALVNKISGLGFAWYLGVTPGAAMVNLTQTAIVAGPVLASRFGAAKSMNALMKGMRDSIRTGGNIERTLRDEELRAYQAMRASGAIDKTQAHNLAGIAEVDSAQYSDSWHRVMKGISYLFHKAEVVNREATGMAAYRLGREQGMSFDAAVQYAEDIIWESHFDYSNANRARFMQSGAAKVLLMFRQYSLSMSYFLWRNFYQTFKGESPKIKQEARRKLLGVLGMTSVFSGALGLPAMSMVFGVANALADALGDDEDPPFDAEAEFRNFLTDFMGADVARLIARGPVNFVTGADIASRVTLDGLWLREPERELEGKALANYWLEQAAGPIGGIFVNAMQGLSLFQQGEAWRGVEAMTPKFVKDALRSIRYSTEGVNTLRGDALIPDLSPAQTVLQLAGLAPAQVNERYDANNAIKRYEESILRSRQRLLDGFALAVRLEDDRMRDSTLQRIRAFNAANPEIPIDAKTIRTSLQARARYTERSLGGVAVNSKIEERAREQGRFAEDQP
jgi:hypothetical protein